MERCYLKFVIDGVELYCHECEDLAPGPLKTLGAKRPLARFSGLGITVSELMTVIERHDGASHGRT